MNEEKQEKETIELTEEERKYQRFVDSWLFPDHKENTEEEKKAHELMNIWHKEWLEARKEKRTVNIFVPEEQKALEKAWHRRKQLHPQPIADELQRDYFEQLKKEEEQKLEETRRRRQADLTFQHSQVPLMNKDEIGLKFVELQIDALKCFIQYVKDIRYCLPLHISVKPYIDIAKHLRRTIGIISLTKTMDENWTKKYGIEVDSIQNQLKLIDKYVKTRRKQMVYL
jgi:hypothetical protein